MALAPFPVSLEGYETSSVKQLVKKINKHADSEGFVESIVCTRKLKNDRRSTANRERKIKRKIKGL